MNNLNQLLNDNSPVNKLLFPAPQATYSQESFKELIWIMRNEQPKIKMPAIFIKYQPVERKNDTEEEKQEDPEDRVRGLLLYSHGNGDDLGTIIEALKEFSRLLKVHILAYEYSGYGIFTNTKSNENELSQNIDDAYRFVLDELKWPEQGIILWGYSMGSGPTLSLTKYKDPAGIIILQSAYSNIKDLAKELAGVWGSVLSNRFDNITRIKKVKCPILFLHGKKDNLIRYQHSEQLYSACEYPKKDIFLIDNVGHCDFDFRRVVLPRVNKFLEEQNWNPPYDNFPTEKEIDKRLKEYKERIKGLPERQSLSNSMSLLSSISGSV